jgi:hypothetical protein
VVTALVCQLVLLAYHQVTTGFDLFPFNGARRYTRKERLAEMASNAILMGLAPIGFAFDIHPLMTYGAFYYFVLFAFEIIIWWIPYLVEPRGKWRRVYNFALSLGTSNFEPGDTLSRWLQVHQRLHADTLSIVPRKPGRVVPNLEHTLLHIWTLVTAVISFRAIYA